MNHILKQSLCLSLFVLLTSFAFVTGEEFVDEVDNNKVIEEQENKDTNLISKANELAEEMDQITNKKKVQWSFNPYNRKFKDKYFNPWVDPLSYNSYWFMYYPPLVEQYYDKQKFKLDSVLFYHNPQLGTQISPIAFAFDELKYRFYIGVGFLMGGHFLMYGHGATQYYGTHLFLDSVIQVEPYIDFIYKDNLRIRLTPIRHICYHFAGDILGDKNLNPNFDNKDNTDNKDKNAPNWFKDIGYEQVHASVNYRWGWFNFYGGLAAAVTNFGTCTCINLFYGYGGVEMKMPLFGDVNLISGVHLGANYDKLAKLTHHIEGNTYSIENVRYEWTPLISAGIGMGIHDWVIGFKFDYGRSRQIYAIENMEMRMGLSAYLYL